MIKNKLLRSSILLFFFWALCFFGLNVGGVVHFMLLFSIVAFITYIYINKFNNRNIALKH